MHKISKKTCFPSTRKVLDFDLNGQHMRKTEVPEGNWVLGCSPDHSTIRPKILSLKGEGNFFKVFLIFSSDRKTLQIMNCAF